MVSTPAPLAEQAGANPGVLHIATITPAGHMDLAERISTLRRVNGLNARQLAALVDVADVDAIATARLALDPELDLASTPGVDLWRQRWARIGLLDADGRVVAGKEADLVFRAGRTARLTRRPGAVDFTAGPPRIASLKRFAGPASTTHSPVMPEPTGTGPAPATPGRFSVEDVARAAEAAGLARKEPGSFGMRVTLVPFDGVSEVGRVDIDGATVVARDQVVIDAYCGIDRMVEQADILMGRRVV